MSRLIGSSYQYLQKSKIPTYKFQRSLPRLKIPKFDLTCQRYLAALEPIYPINSNEYQQARDSIGKFQFNEGKLLHQSLLHYDKTQKHTSYINEFWFNMYLSSRSPLPLNFNPFLAYRDAPTSGQMDQIVRCTNFLISAMRFKRSLEEELLEPEVFHLDPKKTAKSSFYRDVMSLVPEAIATYVSFAFKAFPLDMSQYKNLFNSTRIPRKDKDEIIKSDPMTNKHILVIKNGQFYVFDVLDQNGDLNSPEFIYANIHYITNNNNQQNNVNDNQLSISELTTADRDFWAGEREHLINLSEMNRENLKKLDSAIFAICLDDIGFEPHQQIDGAHNFLHGYNSKGPLNRWFDKSFSLIVTKGGHSCVNFEHSWGDGVAILRFFNDTFYDSTKNYQIDEPIKNPETFSVCVKRLDFDLDNRLKESITICRKKHMEQTSNLELGAVQYEKLDRNYFKKNKLSPDAMSQLSFQLAYKKLYNNQTPVTYESCSTAAFRGGRTETVRPCTNETNTASQAMIDKKKSKGEIVELLKKSSAKHFQLCKEASMGDGFDRHLFGLKEIAFKSGHKLPDLYEDSVFKQSQHYTLSTSTLYGECFSGGGFAPVVPDGFGLGYGYVDKSFGVLVSSYKDRRNNTQFCQALNDSLDDLRKIVES